MEIEPKIFVRLLGIEVDNKLLFHEHVASLCSQAVTRNKETTKPNG